MVTDNTITAPATPCSNMSNWWWGKFTATGTSTDLFLWGKDEIGASIEVFEGPCGASMTEIFCNSNTGAKNNPNWGNMVTVPGKQYYVIVKSSTGMSQGRLCIYSEPAEATKPVCGADMSFEGGTSNGWTGNWGSYHLATAPGSVFTWDLYNASKPANLYQVTSGTGRDGFVSFLPVVAPGGGNNSFRIGSYGTAEGEPGTVNGVTNQQLHAAAASASYCFTVNSSNAGFGYKYAVVLDAPSHPAELQPLFDVIITKQSNGDTLPCARYSHYPKDGVSPFYYVGSNLDISTGDGIAFTPWVDVVTDLSGYIGQTVCVTFRVRDCEGGGNATCCPADSGTYYGSHFAYAYFDTYCIPMTITNPEFCVGAASIQICAPSGYMSYSWPAGQPGLTGSPTTQCVTIDNPVPGTNYTVNMISYSGCPVNMTIPLKAIPTLTSSDASICPGATANISVTGTGAGPYTYSWSNGLGSSPTQSVSPTATTIYTVTVTNGSSCSSTETITVTVSSCIQVSVTGGAVCPGSCLNLTAVASIGTPPYTYSWNPGGTTGDTFNACPNVTTTYSVTATDSTGATKTSTVTVTINNPAVLTGSSTPADCGSNNGTASISATGGIPGYSYVWSVGGATSATISNLIPGNYTVTATDGNGCVSSTTVFVDSVAGIVTTTAVNVSCNGGSDGIVSATISGGSPAYTYSWSNGSSAQTTNGLGQGTYTVTVKDGGACTSTSVVTVNQPSALAISTSTTPGGCSLPIGTATATTTGGTSGYSYLWSPGGATSATVSNLSSGTYTVTTTDANGCTATTTTIVGTTVAGTVTAVSTDVSCNNSNDGTATASITGGTPGFTYSWSNGSAGQTINGLVQGNYTVTVIDGAGCSSTTIVTINQPTSVLPTASGTSATCDQTNGTATVSSVGGTPAYTFLWSAGGATNATISNLAAGTYTVTTTDAKGCTAVTTVVIAGTSSVVAIANATDVVCKGNNNGTVTVSVIGGTDPLTYSWSNGTSGLSIITGLNPTTYIVTVTDANGCSSTATATVGIKSTLTAGFTPDPTTGTQPVTVNFTNTSIGANSFEWYFGDTTQSALTDPTHLYPYAGTYTVILVARDSLGCIDTAKYDIFIKEKCMLFLIPNVFTPNGDTRNDIFRIRGKCIIAFDALVYDRWGLKMYGWNDINGGWDGTSNGKEAPDGTYYYIVKATGADGVQYDQAGFLQLIR
ncbi:MAG: gliding motility-associated C-terminal domain-containing protein [Bacteroidetes bacterium]|nr:gliding motility-associated C-terminal domain-containing protein [Bacteroidota bacterium]